MKTKYKVILSMFVLFAILLLILNPVVSYCTKVYTPKIVNNHINGKLKINKVNINLFRGKIRISDITLLNSMDEEIAKVDNIFFNLRIRKILLGKIYIEELEINKPNAKIEYVENELNFSKLVKKKKSNDKEKVKDKKENKLKLILNSFYVNEPKISFVDLDRNINIGYKLNSFRVNDFIFSDKISLNSIINKENFLDIKTDVNLKDDTLKVKIDLLKININTFNKVLKNFLNISSIRGVLNGEIELDINTVSKDILLKSNLELNDFYMNSENKKEIVSLKNLSIDVNKISNSKIDINDIILDSLNFNFDLNKTGNNILEIIKPITKDKQSTKPSETTKNGKKNNLLKYNIKEIVLKNSSFTFNDSSKENVTEMKLFDINLKLNNIRSEQSTIKYNFETKINENESIIKIDGEVNQPKEISVKSKISINKLNLERFENILKEFINFNKLKGYLSVNSDLVIELGKEMDLNVIGELNLSKVSFVDSKSIEIVKFEKLNLVLDKVDLGEKILQIGNFEILNPMISMYLEKDSNTISNILKTKMPNENKEDKKMKPTDKNDIFQIDLKKFSLEKGSFNFVDFSFEENFVYKINSFDISLINFNNFNKNRSEIKLNSVLGGESVFNLDGSFNLNEGLKADITSNIKNFKLVELKKIINKYSPVELKNGELSYSGKLNLNNNNIDLSNNIKLKELRVGKDNKNIFDLKLPLNVVLNILENPNKEIKLDIPIKGDLKNPDFDIKKTIFKSIKDLLINTATSPLKVLKTFSGDKKDLSKITVKFGEKINKTEEEKLKSLGSILKKKKELKIIFNETYSLETLVKLKALEFLKNKYISDNKLKLKISEVNIVDEGFIDFSNRLVKVEDKNLSIDEKAYKIFNKKEISKKVKEEIDLYKDKVEKILNKTKLEKNSFIFKENVLEGSNQDTIDYNVEISNKD